LAEAVALTLTEADFMEKVIARARARGWLVHHCRPCRKADGGWTTPVQGHTGFPDLVLARDGVVLFRELKTDGGRLTDAQRHWLEVLGGEVWRPNDWNEVEAIIDAPIEETR
jgi:hypothetical protein